MANPGLNHCTGKTTAFVRQADIRVRLMLLMAPGAIKRVLINEPWYYRRTVIIRRRGPDSGPRLFFRA